MDRPKIGVGVLIVRDGKILLGKRKGAHGAGQWSVPGGHMEAGEEFDETCEREVEEETGMHLFLESVAPVYFTNDIFRAEDLHYVTLFFFAEAAGEPKNMEPDRLDGEWEYFDLYHLPEPLFPPLSQLLAKDEIREFFKAHDELPWWIPLAFWVPLGIFLAYLVSKIFST